MDNTALNNLTLVIAVLSDEVGVKLHLPTNEAGSSDAFGGESVAAERAAHVCLTPEGRRFTVTFQMNGRPRRVLSDPVPESFAWLDGTLRPQVLPGCECHMSKDTALLLGIVIRSVCEAATELRQSRISEPALENIRRVIASLRGRVDPQPRDADSDARRTSTLHGVPSLAAFFADSNNHAARQLGSIFADLTAATLGSPNLMALNGDFVVETPRLEPSCRKCRESDAAPCFESDLRCLIAAAVATPETPTEVTVLQHTCHAGWLELFVPVMVDGLIVGLVFAGQLSARQQGDQKGVAQAKREVRGLAALLGQLFASYCEARNEAELLECLVRLPPGDVEAVAREVCHTVHRVLGVGACSVFRRDGSHLVLAATTVASFWVRERGRDRAEQVAAEKALGKSFYTIGSPTEEGLTGSVVSGNRNVIVYPRPSDPPALNEISHWTGKCSEIEDAAQCLVARIAPKTGPCYGVLRISRPRGVRPLGPMIRDLLGNFAMQVGTALAAWESEAREDKNREVMDELIKELSEARPESAAAWERHLRRCLIKTLRHAGMPLERIGLLTGSRKSQAIVLELAAMNSVHWWPCSQLSVERIPASGYYAPGALPAEVARDLGGVLSPKHCLIYGEEHGGPNDDASICTILIFQMAAKLDPPIESFCRAVGERLIRRDVITRLFLKQEADFRQFQTHVVDVRHDLKTSLQHVQGFSAELIHALHREAKTESSKDTEELLQRSIGEQMDLINQLRAPRTKDTPACEERMDLLKFLLEEIPLYEIVARDYGVTIKAQPPTSTTRAVVQCLRTDLMRGFGALLDNAIKYSYRGTVRSFEVHVRHEVQGEMATISISNYGIGIRPEKLAHMNERGRGEVTDSRVERPGEGFGVVIAKSVFEHTLGGTIEYTSVPDGNITSTREPFHRYITTATIRVPVERE